jgi:hypothetical protein
MHIHVLACPWSLWKKGEQEMQRRKKFPIPIEEIVKVIVLIAEVVIILAGSGRRWDDR